MGCNFYILNHHQVNFASHIPVASATEANLDILAACPAHEFRVLFH